MDSTDPTPKPVEYRDFLDADTLRTNIFKGVKDAYAQKTSENKTHQLVFKDVDYDKPKDFTTKEEKDAVIGRRRLYWNLKGRLALVDKATGQTISEDSAPRKIAEVPYLTRRGTFIHNGTEYLTANQQRLKPGAYTRIQANGDVETQFNVLKGAGFRINMTPDTGVFRVDVRQGTMKLYPVLKALGVGDDDLVKLWGKDLFNVNKASDDKSSGVTVGKLVNKLGRFADQDLRPEDALKRLPEILSSMELDPEVMQRTMGKPYSNITAEVILGATKKILDVHQHKVDADDRDDIPYQSFHGPEDFFKEHVEKDAGQYLKNALWKAAFKKDVANIPDGYFSKQLQSVILGSGLSGALTEVNPLDILDQRYKVIRMGEGGIGDTNVVPKSARGVQPSHFGFIDPLKVPESMKLALDSRLASGTKKGSDGRIYQTMTNARTGKPEMIHTGTAANKVVAFPGELERGTPKVRAMVKGKMRYVPVGEVDYELTHTSGMWSPLTNMIPFLSGIKGQRGSMGARMQSQALALAEPETPYVQPLMADGKTAYHKSFGKYVGAKFADDIGEVVKVTPDEIIVRHKDGEKSYDIYNNFPLNQKGFIHNTPAVKPGDIVQPGQLLAKSNYTNAKGEVAMGRNILTA
jgi:DNA-directed RNA polymerase beta subunit